MSASNYLENEIITYLLTRGETWSVALHTDNPGEDGSANEVSSTDTGYERVDVLGDNTKWTADEAGGMANSDLITFPQATGDWGTVTHFSVRNAGNCMWYGTLSTSKTINTGDFYEIGIAGLTLSVT